MTEPSFSIATPKDILNLMKPVTMNQVATMAKICAKVMERSAISREHLYPPVLLFAANPAVYRHHAEELVTRFDNGEDMDRPTQAEKLALLMALWKRDDSTLDHMLSLLVIHYAKGIAPEAPGAGADFRKRAYEVSEKASAFMEKAEAWLERDAVKGRACYQQGLWEDPGHH